MSRATRIAARVLATVGITAGATLGIAGAADAAPSTRLTINGPYCYSGRSTFLCQASISGGIGAIQIRWSTTPAYAQVGANNGLSFSGRCSTWQRYTVTVVATDSAGLSATESRSLFCWPYA